MFNILHIMAKKRCKTCLLPELEAGAADGGYIRGVQLAGGCKHSVGVCDDGGKAGREDDGAAGAAGGGHIRTVQLADGSFLSTNDLSILIGLMLSTVLSLGVITLTLCETLVAYSQ
jgi:hypothetical protein